MPRTRLIVGRFIAVCLSPVWAISHLVVLLVWGVGFPLAYVVGGRNGIEWWTDQVLFGSVDGLEQVMRRLAGDDA